MTRSNTTLAEDIRPSRVARGTLASSQQKPKASLATRNRMGSVPNVKVVATGSYVPGKVVTNEDLAALGCDSDWIVRRTGIRERRRAAPGQATSDLCYRAALDCMRRAGVTADQIDLIVVATMTPDHPTPSTACLLQEKLGATAPAMDVNAACAGFVYAMTTAAQFVATGNSKCALVVGADMMSTTINPNDIKTYPLFGDGAGAMILGPQTSDEGGGILSYQLGSEGSGGEMLRIPVGGTREMMTAENVNSDDRFLVMDGRTVFKWAVRVVRESATEVLEDAGLDANDLSLIVLHQANQRIIDSAVADLNVAAENVYVNLDRYGNTSAGSVPLALDEAVKSDRIKKGDYVLLSGFGAGLSWGTLVLRW